MCIATHSRADTCSATSALAEASYSSPTSLRYYTSDAHPPTPICGNVRCDIAPPPPPRRLTARHRASQPPTPHRDLRGHWIGITMFGLMRVAIG
eukprot:1501249-Pyramimonas_sp.AAC.1